MQKSGKVAQRGLKEFNTLNWPLLSFAFFHCLCCDYCVIFFFGTAISKSTRNCLSDLSNTCPSELELRFVSKPAALAVPGQAGDSTDNNGHTFLISVECQKRGIRERSLSCVKE